ncbi:MAG: PA2169 family four-helix-bundle protein [Comamonadaceae bacterium]|nr:MAG: PA2169 family four-helix-bundle protein [Comamonadaceae bacterium]
MQERNTPVADANRDPITGAPGAHPVGTGVGATGGAVAGAAAGTIAGPIGTVVGMIAGAVVGGLAGKGVAERINPTVEEAHWRERYAKEPYVEAGRPYDDYGPAYAIGWTERDRLAADFDAVEPDLAAQWEARRGRSTLSWDQARPAARESWSQVNRRYLSDDVAADAEPLANDEVVDVLNDLLENCRDGEYGFRACAEEVESPAAKQLFERRAAGCREAEAQLLPLIAAYGGKPAEGGTTSGALHRGWVHVKGSVGANSELAILESCERGEDTAIARYRKALKQNLPSDVRAVVEQQAQGAQRNHDEIRDLRNVARAERD